MHQGMRGALNTPHELFGGRRSMHGIFEGEVHSIWDLWISGLQKCKSNDFFEVGGHKFSVRSIKYRLISRGLPLLGSSYPKNCVCVGGDV
jgi:hypothetical protein